MKIDWEEVKDNAKGIFGMALVIVLSGGAAGILIGTLLGCMYTVLALFGLRL